MVGSEGTLGFISNVTYNTVREVHHKVRFNTSLPTDTHELLLRGLMLDAQKSGCYISPQLRQTQHS